MGINVAPQAGKKAVCFPLFGQTVLLPSFRRGWGRWSAPTVGGKSIRPFSPLFSPLNPLSPWEFVK